MALNLLTAYSSDSEDEEEEEQQQGKSSTSTSTGNTTRLPLPESIASWKGVAHHQEVTDQPEKHQGRVRSFKHERGNWPTLVYLEYEPGQSVQAWMSSIPEKLPIECTASTDRLHVSVTRTLILKFHWIESFAQDLKKLCNRTDRFSLELSNLRAYCNDERTRTFLGIECRNPDGILHSFINELNGLLEEYGLPPFYQEHSNHVSFLWCIGDETKRLSEAAFSLNADLDQFLAENVQERYIRVNEIHFKTGNQLYAFKLKQ